VFHKQPIPVRVDGGIRLVHTLQYRLPLQAGRRHRAPVRAPVRG